MRRLLLLVQIDIGNEALCFAPPKPFSILLFSSELNYEDEASTKKITIAGISLCIHTTEHYENSIKKKDIGYRKNTDKIAWVV